MEVIQVNTFSFEMKLRMDDLGMLAEILWLHVGDKYLLLDADGSGLYLPEPLT